MQSRNRFGTQFFLKSIPTKKEWSKAKKKKKVSLINSSSVKKNSLFDLCHLPVLLIFATTKKTSKFFFRKNNDIVARINNAILNKKIIYLLRVVYLPL